MNIPKGLIYIPDYIGNLKDNFLTVIDNQPWSNELSRRTQHYGYKYSYKNRSINSSMKCEPITGLFMWLAEKLFTDRFFRKIPDQLIINEYLPGQGIGAHIDCIPCFDDVIASISLGDEYPMRFEGGSEQVDIPLEVGSLVCLTGESRYSWRHSIVARKEDNGRPRGRRVSMTFRNVILEN